MIKKAISLFGILLGFHFSYAQVVRVQAGPVISNLEWSIDNIAKRGSDKYLLGNSAFIGMDYLNSRYFNLSTNIGYLQKGDQSEIAYTKDNGEVLEFPMLKAEFEYFSANTLAEFKWPVGNWLTPFISMGPRIDYMYSKPQDFSFIEEISELPDYTYGANLGGGLRIDFTRLQVGVRSDYYLNLSKMATWVSNNKDSWIEDKTFLVNLTVGYKLKR